DGRGERSERAERCGSERASYLYRSADPPFVPAQAGTQTLKASVRDPGSPPARGRTEPVDPVEDALQRTERCRGGCRGAERCSANGLPVTDHSVPPLLLLRL